MAKAYVAGLRVGRRQAMQLHGGMGSRGVPVSRYFVDARVLRSRGADETLCLKVIARRSRAVGDLGN